MKRKKPDDEPMDGKYYIVGVCFYCRKAIQAIQPGGGKVQHTDGTEYCGEWKCKEDDCHAVFANYADYIAHKAERHGLLEGRIHEARGG